MHNQSAMIWHFTTLRAIYIMLARSPYHWYYCATSTDLNTLSQVPRLFPCSKAFCWALLSGPTLLPSHGCVAPPTASIQAFPRLPTWALRPCDYTLHVLHGPCSPALHGTSGPSCPNRSTKRPKRFLLSPVTLQAHPSDPVRVLQSICLDLIALLLGAKYQTCGRNKKIKQIKK